MKDVFSLYYKIPSVSCNRSKNGVETQSGSDTGSVTEEVKRKEQIF